MKLYTIIAFLFVFAAANSQDSDKIAIGNVKNIYSKILKEDRRIWIYNPADGHNIKDKERYPVLYLLDPEDHFFSTVGMIKEMKGRWPDMIVVGIANTDRNRDLRPKSEKKEYSGAGENFIHFIEDELIPYIDASYPTAPYRIFSGHSLGGLTVVNTLLTKSNLFNAYIAIDPSLWWNEQQLVKQSTKDLSDKKFKNISLFVGRAKNMPPKMDTIQALKDTTQFTLLYRSVTKFIDNLKGTKNNELRWTSKFYPEESHGTVALNAQYDALKFLFNYYQFRTSLFEFNPDMDIDEAVAAHYKNISEKLGYKVLPSNDLINNLGYTCINLKKWNKAEALFKINIINYPEDPNVYDSMGDFYEATGNNSKAIENYTKALTLGNDSETKRKLDTLKAKK